MLGVCKDAFAPRLALVAPWMDHGNIMQYLQDRPDERAEPLVCISSLSLSSRLKSNQLHQGAEGLLYLHGLDPPLVHGDIKGVCRAEKTDYDPMSDDF